MQSRCLVLFLLARGLCRNSFAYGSVYESFSVSVWFLFRRVNSDIFTGFNTGVWRFLCIFGDYPICPGFLRSGYATVWAKSNHTASWKVPAFRRFNSWNVFYAVHRLHLLSDYIIFPTWNNVKSFLHKTRKGSGKISLWKNIIRKRIYLLLFLPNFDITAIWRSIHCQKNTQASSPRKIRLMICAKSWLGRMLA